MILLARHQDSVAVDVSLCLDPELPPPAFLRYLRSLVMVSGYIEHVPVSEVLIYFQLFLTLKTLGGRVPRFEAKRTPVV